MAAPRTASLTSPWNMSRGAVVAQTSRSGRSLPTVLPRETRPLHRHGQHKAIAQSAGRIYHRTVNRVLTVCLTGRAHPRTVHKRLSERSSAQEAMENKPVDQRQITEAELRSLEALLQVLMQDAPLIAGLSILEIQEIERARETVGSLIGKSATVRAPDE